MFSSFIGCLLPNNTFDTCKSLLLSSRSQVFNMLWPDANEREMQAHSYVVVIMQDNSKPLSSGARPQVNSDQLASRCDALVLLERTFLRRFEETLRPSLRLSCSPSIPRAQME